MGKIIITGSTGNVGIPVLDYLHRLGRGVDTVACVTDPARPGNISSVSPDAEIRMIDMENPATFGHALEGGELLFLLRPPQISDSEKFRPLLEKAKELDYRGVVFLSVQSADRQSYIPHAKIEKLIREIGLPHVFLRPGYFMQNLTSTLSDDVREGTIMLPAGKTPFMWTDADNIGEAAANMLHRFDEYVNTAIEITGSELLSFGEAVSRINAAIGTHLKYSSVNLVRFWRHRKRQGTPGAMIAVMIMLHYLPRFQKPPLVSHAYTEITGKQPTTLEQFARRESAKLGGRAQSLSK